MISVIDESCLAFGVTKGKLCDTPLRWIFVGACASRFYNYKDAQVCDVQINFVWG